jgi:membrane-associated phospholipid phosphatase
MPRQGIVTLPPTRVDLAVSKACKRMATPAREKSLRAIMWLADEKLMLSAVALFWLGAHLRARRQEIRREADRMLASVALAGLLPDVFKYLFDRQRPDRTLVHGRRHGIPRTGNRWDSFPSGHALHIGAIAGPLLRLAPGWVRPLVGVGLLALASTRVLLLAHYLTDVAAGLIIGAGLGRIARCLSESTELE